MKKIIGFLKRTGLYETRPVCWLKNCVLRFMGRSIKKNGLACLSEINDCMRDAGCAYWVDFGTLLGLYRDGKLLSHDFDIDFSIMKEDYSESLKDNMQKRGFQLCKEYFAFGELVEQSWRWNGVYVDLFMYQRKEDKVFYYSFYTEKEVKETKIAEGVYRFSGLDARSVLLPPVRPCLQKLGGVSVMAPGDKDEHLRLIYGETFMTPDKTWQPSDNPAIFKVENMEMYANRYVIK